MIPLPLFSSPSGAIPVMIREMGKEWEDELPAEVDVVDQQPITIL